MPIKDTLLFYLLSAASKLSRPISSRAARRFRNSAKKRDPKRTTAHNQQLGRQGFDGSGRADEFVPFDPQPKPELAVRAIAHYLPQFHPFKENDDWWGKGFTEWTNVGKAIPNFPGHYQPHCPIHLGYYDLRLPEVMVEQTRIAKAYGIGGFSYYYYWFGGKTLMEGPLEQMLGNPDADMPFCLNWANENWTRRWDGREHDVLIAQNHSIEDSVSLLRHIRKYIEDPRYIRINGRPVFIVYRANIIPDIQETTKVWRQEAQRWGEPDLYLIAAQTFDIGNPEQLGFDAALEFPPQQVKRTDITGEMEVYNPEFTGAILDYEAVVDAELDKSEPGYKLFRSSTLSWDNTARNQDASRIMGRFSIEAYKRWTAHLGNQVLSQDKYNADEKIIFINAWNEWAEGTHLEPDQRYGFAYLQATYDALPKKR
ncbi:MULTISPECIES: glycoside hydrolase family 99-like domain-containing protein [unclassified Ruegeria]|uniref:glycosyltransferase WbsX family protein n=1 Tax=unclassified Ruegeria TaxID=2625375 RepID=UPI001487C26E|nr:MULTISPECIES: glycoside hydrolase family 99-like domain-containing protein [unclassified Ruegeria]NOD34443.1 glycosyl hydrolase [Ruegeria sp. HKCCD7296]NOE34268.1 glycosyl hydrolase [Ruegeria sp. HKCCD7318]NOE40333.1 glycosyl hydrolase [Ruegeria sp. HKCCD7319]